MVAPVAPFTAAGVSSIASTTQFGAASVMLSIAAESPAWPCTSILIDILVTFCIAAAHVAAVVPNSELVNGMMYGGPAVPLLVPGSLGISFGMLKLDENVPDPVSIIIRPVSLRSVFWMVSSCQRS
jgi:hypothetical protein